MVGTVALVPQAVDAVSVPVVASGGIMDGRGLAAGSASPDAGFGLSGIRERAEIMGGSARIDSSPGQGLNLQVMLPLQSLTK